MNKGPLGHTQGLRIGAQEGLVSHRALGCCCCLLLLHALYQAAAC